MNKGIFFPGWICFLAFLSVGPAAAQGPEITFSQEKWDFGRIKEGEVVTHVFSFTNTGDAVLEIQRVRTSCGCAAALVSQKKLSPGEKGEIKVTFNTRGYSGNVTKYVYVHSNDPRRSHVQLAVSASIDVPPRPRIGLDRYTIDLGLVLEGEKLAADAVIGNTGELELEVHLSHKNALFLSGGDEIQGPVKIPAGKSKSVKIQLQPGNSTGLLREYILLKTNDPQRSNLSIYMSGYIVTEDQLRDLFDTYRDIIRK